MSIQRSLLCLFIVSGILFVTDAVTQAQLGDRSSSGGANAMGGGSGKSVESKGSMNQNRHHDRTPSRSMGEGRPEMMRPEQSAGAPLGRAPDSSGSTPAGPGGGSDSGAGSGSMGGPGSSGR